MDVDFEDINRAIVLYVGIEKKSFPMVEEKRVFKEFGPKKGKKLLKYVDQIFHELYNIEIDWNEHSLVSATEFVCEEIAKRYPKLSESAIQALGWDYSYNWR
ncbi:MAG: hypothetical protein GF311_18805 [Candidatus Lokiarchaeota archaeon]|nr:hypothetical protein [Candidatus Lokiarchaeota archaeon]